MTKFQKTKMQLQDPNNPGYVTAMDFAATKLRELGAANERLKLALLACNLSPAVVDAIEKGE